MKKHNKAEQREILTINLRLLAAIFLAVFTGYGVYFVGNIIYYKLPLIFTFYDFLVLFSFIPIYFCYLLFTKLRYIRPFKYNLIYAFFVTFLFIIIPLGKEYDSISSLIGEFIDGLFGWEESAILVFLFISILKMFVISIATGWIFKKIYRRKND